MAPQLGLYCLKLNFLKVKFILISIPTIYLSYSYNPVATNTNLRALTLVYPCSGLNIDSTDVTDYRNLSTEVHVAS